MSFIGEIYLPLNYLYRSLLVTWSAALQIAWNKRKINMRKQFNSHRVFLVYKHGRWFIVLYHRQNIWSRKIALKTARDGEKTWHMTQLTFSSNFYWNICFKFCILEQIIATVLFLCISSINNKRSSLKFQSTTAPTNRGWSACVCTQIWPAWVSGIHSK